MTDQHEFDSEPNLPPVILSKTGQPEIGEHVWIDKTTRSEWQLLVRVRDENVEQVLDAQWRILHEGEMFPDFVPLEIMSNNEPVRDLPPITVSTAVLLPYQCHRLELVVSGSFIGLTDSQYFGLVAPGDETDVARAVWWIWEGQGREATAAQKAAILDSCQAIEDLLNAETPVTEETAQ